MDIFLDVEVGVDADAMPARSNGRELRCLDRTVVAEGEESQGRVGTCGIDESADPLEGNVVGGEVEDLEGLGTDGGEGRDEGRCSPFSNGSALDVEVDETGEGVEEGDEEVGEGLKPEAGAGKGIRVGPGEVEVGEVGQGAGQALDQSGPVLFPDLCLRQVERVERGGKHDLLQSVLVGEREGGPLGDLVVGDRKLDQVGEGSKGGPRLGGHERRDGAHAPAGLELCPCIVHVEVCERLEGGQRGLHECIEIDAGGAEVEPRGNDVQGREEADGQRVQDVGDQLGQVGHHGCVGERCSGQIELVQDVEGAGGLCLLGRAKGGTVGVEEEGERVGRQGTECQAGDGGVGAEEGDDEACDPRGKLDFVEGQVLEV